VPKPLASSWRLGPPPLVPALDGSISLTPDNVSHDSESSSAAPSGKELTEAAQAGEPSAVRWIRAYVPGPPTFAAVQLTIAREYGFARSPRLKGRVETAAMALVEQAVAFVRASLSGSAIQRAVRMLAAEPRIPGDDLWAAIVLGDVEQVRQAGGALRPAKQCSC
jgi:hypothetical protein